jgi:hypothetical protein
MGAIRVALTLNHITGKWDWSADLKDGTIAGAGFDTSQQALIDASHADGIEGHKFYGVAEKHDVFRDESDTDEQFEEQSEEPVIP